MFLLEEEMLNYEKFSPREILKYVKFLVPALSCRVIPCDGRDRKSHTSLTCWIAANKLHQIFLEVLNIGVGLNLIMIALMNYITKEQSQPTMFNYGF